VIKTEILRDVMQSLVRSKDRPGDTAATLAAWSDY
jgi:hypothetical protein